MIRPTPSIERGGLLPVSARPTLTLRRLDPRNLRQPFLRIPFRKVPSLTLLGRRRCEFFHSGREKFVNGPLGESDSARSVVSRARSSVGYQQIVPTISIPLGWLSEVSDTLCPGTPYLTAKRRGIGFVRYPTQAQLAGADRMSVGAVYSKKPGAARKKLPLTSLPQHF
jgi:hypothetical protein